jgi:Arc/MetJ-type ribon-helix-helix transcriptional regulator
MTTLSIRVDDETKAKIDRAAKADGHSTYADFIRSVLTTELETRGEDGAKRAVIRDSTGEGKGTTTYDKIVLENELKTLKIEIALKDELLKAKEAHIGDLATQVGWYHRYALPPSTAEKKQHWWKRKGKKG